MKSWEVVKVLSEDPSRRFTCEGIVAENIDGSIILRKDGIDFGFCVDDEWEEIIEPVDFVTAINSGSRIKPVNNEYRSFVSVDNWLFMFNKLGKDKAIKLINGKWEIRPD